MSEVRSQRNLLNLLGSHNQSMANHKFKSKIVQLQLKLLLLFHHCLKKGLSRSVGLNTPSLPPSPSHSLSSVIQYMGAGMEPLPHHTVQPYLRPSRLSLGGRHPGPADLQHRLKPSTWAGPHRLRMRPGVSRAPCSPDRYEENMVWALNISMCL